MRYISTRGAAPILGFEETLLAGMARDGGLYVPNSWPRFDAAQWTALAGRPYAEAALAILRPFVGRTIASGDLERMVTDAYGAFDHVAVAPLRQIGPNDWLLELFHGPTLAFKDYALQLVGRLFDHVLARRGQRVTIVGATSGDTGSAAIEACRDRDAIEIFILHPLGRTSPIQRRQMTTVQSANVHNIAIEGTFDDCQDLVKAMFADLKFRDELNLSAVNSINWARIAAQIVYYATAAIALGAPRRKVAFTVPTGNFGNVFAAHAARAMGLPIERLVVASNRNDILHRMLAADDMSVVPVEPSLSPSMDIQVSSNFERLLFELTGRNGKATAALIAEFRATGRLKLGRTRWRRLRELFDGARADDEETVAMIAQVWRETGELVDPHTAVGVFASRARRGDARVPMVTLATAHAAKFPDAVERATGVRPALPARLADLDRRPERFIAMPDNLAAVQAYMRDRLRVAA